MRELVLELCLTWRGELCLLAFCWHRCRRGNFRLSPWPVSVAGVAASIWLGTSSEIGFSSSMASLSSKMLLPQVPRA